MITKIYKPKIHKQMTTITIEIDEVKRARVKQILRKKGIKPNTKNVVDYALKFTLDYHTEVELKKIK